MALHRINFDVTDANTRGDTHTVGAVLYDKANDRLGVINAANELLVHDQDILDKLNAGVTVSATDLDIRNLAHTQDSVRLGDGTTLFTSTTVGADTGLDVNVINAELNVNLQDGAGTDITSTGGALDVNIASGTLTTSDAALANVALKQVAEVVGTTAALVVDAADELASRKYFFAYNNDNRDVFIGDATVSAANGFPIPPGAILEARIGDAVDIYMIGDKASTDVRTLQLS